MKLFMLTLLILGSIIICPSSHAEEEREVLYWHDPMVPGPKFDKPGKSPFMDMDLVPVYADEADDSDGGTAGAIRINPAFIQNIGVKTAHAKMETFGKTIRAYGKLTANPRLTHKVALRVEGWISTLTTSAQGDEVKTGDVLFTLHSPDLISAQKDYVTAKNAGLASRAKATIERLGLLGMDDTAIGKLKKSGTVMENVPFHAPQNGTVMSLNLMQGAYVKPSAEVLTLQSFATIWVEADVAEKDLRFLQLGQQATIHLPNRADPISTTIDFIHPVVDEQTRTGKVRMIVNNDGTLRPGQFADVVITAQPIARLAVPRNAVLYDSNGAHVVVALDDGRFRPQPIDVGITTNNLTEVVAGLSVSDEVVTSGQFLIDADARLRSGMGDMGNMPAMDMEAQPAPAMDMEENSHAH